MGQTVEVVPATDVEAWHIATMWPFPNLRLRITDKRNGKFYLEAWMASSDGTRTFLNNYIGPLEFGPETGA